MEALRRGKQTAEVFERATRATSYFHSFAPGTGRAIEHVEPISIADARQLFAEYKRAKLTQATTAPSSSSWARRSGRPALRSRRPRARRTAGGRADANSIAPSLRSCSAGSCPRHDRGSCHSEGALDEC